MDPLKNTPWVAELYDENSSELSYFLFVEQEVLFCVSSFSKAIFLWFATFYVFNLHYEKSTREVPLFFQEYVFGHPDPCKKTSTYLSVSTDIQRNIETSA